MNYRSARVNYSDMETYPFFTHVSLQSKTCDDPEVMPSSLKTKKYDNQNQKLVVRESYLKGLKKVKILSTVDVADSCIARQSLEMGRSTRRNHLKPDNVVDTQSILISQDRITTTQEPTRDSDRRTSTNYNQLTILRRSIEKCVDIVPGGTRPNVESLCVLIISNLFKLFHRNEDPDGRINLRN